MPTVQVNGTRLYYEDTGSGEETILFSHGLLWDTCLFDGQIAALRDCYRCVAYDHRGQGRSEAPGKTAIDVETLYTDVVGLLEQLGITRCHFAGLSMGGFVALRLALRRPDLLQSIILIATSADPEPRSRLFPYWFFGQLFRFGRKRLACWLSWRVLFGRTFRRDPARAALRQEWFRRLFANKFDIGRAVNGVICRQGVHEEIDRIRVPALILVGEEDRATVPAKAERLHERIAGSKLLRIPNAGHTLTVEAPAAVNAALRTFLDGLPRCSGGSIC